MDNIQTISDILQLLFLAIGTYNFYRFIKDKRQQRIFANVQYHTNDKEFIEKYLNENHIGIDTFNLPAEHKVLIIQKYLKQKVNRHFAYSVIFIIFFVILCAFKLTTLSIEHADPKPTDKIEQLVKGKIAYNIPDTMKLEQSYRAIVSITRAQNDSILLEGLNSSDFEIEQITISSRVKASLLDPTKINFDINPLSLEEQLVDDSTNTTWRWNIRPMKSGRNVLMLKVSIKIKNRIGETPKDILVFDKPFFVKSSIATEAKNIFSEYWQWFMTVLIIPFFLWLRNIYITRKNNKKNKREPIGFKKSGT